MKRFRVRSMVSIPTVAENHREHRKAVSTCLSRSLDGLYDERADFMRRTGAGWVLSYATSVIPFHTSG